ncbi:MAG: cupin domain-containing protein [Patescibacteria group bacterium]
MKGYVENIEKITRENTNFRTVLYTGKNCQLVVMCIAPNEEIGLEMHTLDQFLRVEDGEGKAILDGVEHAIFDGSAIIVPAGTNHNIINTSVTKPLRLYTLYAPPNHKDGIVHITKKDAETNEEHFDGLTTE